MNRTTNTKKMGFSLWGEAEGAWGIFTSILCEGFEATYAKILASREMTVGDVLDFVELCSNDDVPCLDKVHHGVVLLDKLDAEFVHEDRNAADMCTCCTGLKSLLGKADREDEIKEHPSLVSILTAINYMTLLALDSYAESHEAEAEKVAAKKKAAEAEDEDADEDADEDTAEDEDVDAEEPKPKKKKASKKKRASKKKEKDSSVDEES